MDRITALHCEEIEGEINKKKEKLMVLWHERVQHSVGQTHT